MRMPKEPGVGLMAMNQIVQIGMEGSRESVELACNRRMRAMMGND